MKILGRFFMSNAFIAWLILTIVLGLETMLAEKLNISSTIFFTVEFIEIVAYFAILTIILKQKKKEK